jgi:hypothetical protein
VNQAAALIDAVQVRELATVLRGLEETGAVPLVFKGAALAHTHYQESWLRPRADTDVLIADSSREPVFARLHELGYERSQLVSGELVMYQARFVRIDHLSVRHALDVHWRVSNPQVVSRVLTHDELVARGTTVTVHGQPMRIPCAVDSLLLACVHRAAHHEDSEDPVWLKDIHLLATGLGPDEWEDFVERASHKGVSALCARGLRLAMERFETRVPRDVVMNVSLDRDEPSSLFLRKNLRPVDRLIADVRAIGPRAAVHLVREHVFPPADYMKATYHVRYRALLPAYYAARVWNGMFKWFQTTRT